jgi:hypothetical protein
MWIMTSYGILMPATIPAEIIQGFRDEWNTNPEPTTSITWDLQVRSRDRKTLIRARKIMKQMKYFVGPIIETRQLDYEYRFYCAAHDFAAMIASEIRAIDYEKFKPTTERKGMGGKKLHSLYNRIWGVVAAHYDPMPPEPRRRKSWWDDIHPWDEK